MRVLVTGARGFVGQNLCAALHEIAVGNDRRADHAIEALEVLSYGRDSTAEELDASCAACDFVIHLAGVNRPKDEAEFMEGNCGLTAALLGALKRHGNRCPVLLSSSAQASLAGRYAGSAYGKSKKAGEELLRAYGEETGAEVLIYRFPNIFGKWCRPNYNSAVATFCHNTANDLPIQINDPSTPMELVYIDDVVDELIRALRGEPSRTADGFCAVPVVHRTTLGHIADTILSFPALRRDLAAPDFSDALTKKLYATFLSYLPPEGFVSEPEMKADARGSFTELLHLGGHGQVSVNITKPGVTKGQHWHHTKVERFIVVHGAALIRERRIGAQPDGSPWPAREFRVDGAHIQVVEMIPGYTHSITNLSEADELVTLMWANERFNAEKPDTFYQEV